MTERIRTGRVEPARQPSRRRPLPVAELAFEPAAGACAAAHPAQYAYAPRTAHAASG
jgi:hypothetical protein